jgi:hypothetical protein
MTLSLRRDGRGLQHAIGLTHRSSERTGRMKLTQIQLAPMQDRRKSGPVRGQKSGSITSFAVHSWMSAATASRWKPFKNRLRSASFLPVCAISVSRSG